VSDFSVSSRSDVLSAMDVVLEVVCAGLGLCCPGVWWGDDPLHVGWFDVFSVGLTRLTLRTVELHSILTLGVMCGLG